MKKRSEGLVHEDIPDSSDFSDGCVTVRLLSNLGFHHDVSEQEVNKHMEMSTMGVGRQ